MRWWIGSALVGDLAGCLAGRTCGRQLVRANHQPYQIGRLWIQQQRAAITDHGPAIRYLHPVAAFADRHFVRVLKQASAIYNALSLENQSCTVQDSTYETCQNLRCPAALTQPACREYRQKNEAHPPMSKRCCPRPEQPQGVSGPSPLPAISFFACRAPQSGKNRMDAQTDVFPRSKSG